jgi:hypothetical protein
LHSDNTLRDVGLSGHPVLLPSPGSVKAQLLPKRTCLFRLHISLLNLFQRKRRINPIHLCVLVVTISSTSQLLQQPVPERYKSLPLFSFISTKIRFLYLSVLPPFFVLLCHYHLYELFTLHWGFNVLDHSFGSGSIFRFEYVY